MAYFTPKEISEMGFESVGENVLISKKSSIYNCSKISIGNNVRIDDFVVLSAGIGGIQIGSFVHIAVHSSLIGAANIELKDFSNISSKVSIYSSNDDYSGSYMTNPMVPEELTNVTSNPVSIGKHVIVGAGTVILPGVDLGDGVAIGALSLVNNSCEDFYVYAGTPAKRVKKRRMDLLKLEDKVVRKG